MSEACRHYVNSWVFKHIPQCVKGGKTNKLLFLFFLNLYLKVFIIILNFLTTSWLFLWNFSSCISQNWTNLCLALKTKNLPIPVRQAKFRNGGLSTSKSNCPRTYSVAWEKVCDISKKKKGKHKVKKDKVRKRKMYKI